MSGERMISVCDQRADAESLAGDRDAFHILGARDIDDDLRSMGRGLELDQQIGAPRENPGGRAVLREQGERMPGIPGGDEIECSHASAPV